MDVRIVHCLLYFNAYLAADIKLKAMKPYMKAITDIGLFTFPLWGTAAGIAAAVMIPSLTRVLFFLWGIGLLLSLVPIWRGDQVPVLGKIVLTVGYCAVASVVVFVTGWASACVFGKSCY